MKELILLEGSRQGGRGGDHGGVQCQGSYGKERFLTCRGGGEF